MKSPSNVWTSGDGMVQLYCGDCLEILPTLSDGSVDAVVTDPPYGAKRPSAWRLDGQRFAEVRGNDAVHANWLMDCYRLLADGGALYAFTCWQTMQQWRDALNGAGFRVRSCIVWDKVIHGLADLATCWAPQHEMILFAAKGRCELAGKRPKDIIRAQRVTPGALQHPYEKPVEVIAPLLDAIAGATVLDPFMGSGTTGVACVQTGRRFVGIELDEGYFEIAKQRIIEAQMQPRLEGM